MLLLFSCSPVWVLSCSTLLDPEAPPSEVAGTQSSLDQWLVLRAWGCCAVRTCVSLTQIPPTTPQIGQGGIKWEFKNESLIQWGRTFSIIQAVWNSQTCWLFYLCKIIADCFSFTTPGCLNREKILEFLSFDSNQINDMFLQLFSKKTYPMNISKQNHVSHCCYRKREHGDGAIGLHGYGHQKRPWVRECANTGTREQ